jgi:protein-L-isoaspartate(D-aspartate) O-methyltransferase
MERNFIWQREDMVTDQIAARGIRDERVLAAMRKVERHLFVPESLRSMAYDDRPLPIGEGQTISQPYIVALMTELLALQGKEKVLEIGTGSGYQAAILAKLAGEVYSIEILKPLAQRANALLTNLGLTNIHVRCADGYESWKEEAPFDAIIVTAAPQEVPPQFVEQLKTGGRMVIPVGDFSQKLNLIVKTEHGIQKQSVAGVVFVPMVHGGKKQRDAQ